MTPTGLFMLDHLSLSKEGVMASPGPGAGCGCAALLELWSAPAALASGMPRAASKVTCLLCLALIAEDALAAQPTAWLRASGRGLEEEGKQPGLGT